MSLLSVHLITYNNEQHIEETLQSILKQEVDFTFEVVVGDDCSTDNTFEIIKKYAAKHPNIFRIHNNKVQQGILKNFKTTLDRCEGTFVFDIAGDDLIKTTDALQKMVDILKRNDKLGFVDSGFDSFYEQTKKTVHFKNRPIIQASKSTYKEAVLLGKIAPIGHCYRKSLLYKYVDFTTYLNMDLTIEDYPILVDMVLNTEFERINEPLHVYRVHDDSYSHKKDLENHLFLKTQMKELFDYFSIKYNFTKEIIETYNNTHYKELLFLAGYFENKDIGEDCFNRIKSKSTMDYIYYYASKNHTFRRILSQLKKLVKV